MMKHLRWWIAASWATAAAATAMALHFWLRAAFQVRTLPERMMEWLLLYVPIDAFASGIQTLGPKAKVYALYGSGVTMAVLLIGLGTLALHRRWSPAGIVALAGALFLVAMAGIMPITGGGFFGLALTQHPVLVNAAYATVTLAYATVLLLGATLTQPAPLATAVAPPAEVDETTEPSTAAGDTGAVAAGDAGPVAAAAPPAPVPASAASAAMSEPSTQPALEVPGGAGDSVPGVTEERVAAGAAPVDAWGRLGRSRRALAATAISAAGTGVAYLAAWRQSSIGGGSAGSDLPLAQLADGLPTAAATATVHPGLRDVPTTLTPELLAAATATVAPAAPAAPTTAPTQAPAVAPTPAPAAAPTQIATTAPAQTLAPTQVPASPPTQVVQVPAPALTQVPAATAIPATQPPQPSQAPPTAAAQASTQPPAPTAAPDAAPLPAPPDARSLARDQDGALTAAVRPKGELAPLITPVQAHYVVTKNAVADPSLDAEGWRLVLDGEVNRPVQVDYRTLRRLPAVELNKTLECISNFTAMCELTYFGCDLISTSLWKGARLRDVLDLAGGLKPGVVSLQVSGADEYSSAIPVALATNPDTLLVYEMNGQTLPRQHGYPVRLLSPGRYGYKSCKWVMGIRALRTEYVDWYGQRNWSRTGVVRTMSRIDTPGSGTKLAAGRQRIAGIAYAGDRGVSAVQVSLDGGRAWQPTVFLEPAIGKDAWVRWTGEFDLRPGQTLTIQSRAIDGTGEVQSDVFNLPQPNGGSGRHSIEVSAVA